MNNERNCNLTMDGQLELGGISALALAKEFGTPLYVMDEARIRTVCKAFTKALNENYGKGTIAYASKAFSTKAIYKIVDSEGLSADVVSAGEIYTALSVGFPAEKLFFHGNNKLIDELEYAVDNKIGHIVIDSLDEIDVLDAICAQKCAIQKVLIRVNPGVEAHTHKAVQTATPDSKFGFSVDNSQALTAAKGVLGAKNLRLSGFHCHIGSQIFEKSAFVVAVDKMADFLSVVKQNLGFETEVLNLGGGFGIKYTAEDPTFTAEDYADYIVSAINALKKALKIRQLSEPYLVFEPGRSIVGEAGTTLYTVGAIKKIPGIRKYVSVDGGMFESPRYALYGSKYDVCLASDPNATPTQTVTIAGKCCESGDIVAADVQLPDVKRGDVLAVFSTGAYHYSMSSNYNRNPIPPVVLVNNGVAEYIVKPQTLDDLCRNDVLPDRLK